MKKILVVVVLVLLAVGGWGQSNVPAEAMDELFEKFRTTNEYKNSLLGIVESSMRNFKYVIVTEDTHDTFIELPTSVCREAVYGGVRFFVVMVLPPGLHIAYTYMFFNDDSTASKNKNRVIDLRTDKGWENVFGLLKHHTVSKGFHPFIEVERLPAIGRPE
jgi:hypothetical protein